MAAQQPKTEDLTTDVTSSKPPVSSQNSAANSVKSDSFRGIEYVPMNDAEVGRSQSLGIGSFLRRLTTGTRAPVQHASSERVLDELTRKDARNVARANSKELPPLASQSPRVRKSESARVGLQTVTLVATETPSAEPTTEKKAQDESNKEQTQVHTPPMPSGEEEAVESTEEKSKDGAGFGTPISTSGQLTSEELPADLTVEPEHEGHESTDATTATLEAAADRSKSEGTTTTEKPKLSEPVTKQDTPVVVEKPAPPAVAENEGVETPVVPAVVVKPAEKPSPPEVVETEAAKTPEVPPPAPIVAAAKDVEEVAPETPDKELRSSKTMVPQNRPQRNLFQRLFTFGGGGSSAHDTTDASIAEDAPETPITPVSSAVPVEVAEVVPPTEGTSAAEPAPTETVPVVEAPVAVASVPSREMHSRVASDLTPDELESLKATFMTEMKQKGIEVEGKYDKSSKDFDSPLMFLLDLHTFGETQQASVRMEHLLEEKYGAGNALVTEFNAAAAREPKTVTEAASTTEPATKTAPAAKEQDTAKDTPIKKEETPEEPTPIMEDTPDAGIYETGLDTAHTVSEKPLEKETPEAETAEIIDPAAASSSGSQIENKENVASPEEAPVEATKQLAEMESETAAVDAPPQIPVHNEAEPETMKTGCFFCRCLHPAAN